MERCAAAVAQENATMDIPDRIRSRLEAPIEYDDMLLLVAALHEIERLRAEEDDLRHDLDITAEVVRDTTVQ